MINQELFDALRVMLGQEGRVVDENHPGTFSCPPMTRSKMTRKGQRYAYAEDWGEKYEFNCPKCGDTRGRLVIGHQFKMRLKVKTSMYFFGQPYRCYNEECDLTDYLGDLPVEGRRLELTAKYKEIEAKPQEFTTYGKPCEDFPGKTVPIISTEMTQPKKPKKGQEPELPRRVVPEYVLHYLRHERGFDPMQLHEKYLVRFAPEGTVWCEGDKEAENEEDRKDKVFFEDRLLIPIVQRGQMVSWQARKVRGNAKKFKYINGKGHKKTEYLYNMDRAKYHPHIVLFEGVTDVWRYGENSVSMFGKKISSTQAQIMYYLWHWVTWKATCVVCLDPDAVAAGKHEWHVEYLRKKQIFAGGVAAAVLKDGDPADHSVLDLRKIIEEARRQCR